MKSITNQIPVGTRFKISVDLDDAPERRFSKIHYSFDIIVFAKMFFFVRTNLMCSSRYSGVVTGVGDVDPRRWPNSKWRCLMVECVCVCVCLVVGNFFCLLLPKFLKLAGSCLHCFMQLHSLSAIFFHAPRIQLTICDPSSLIGRLLCAIIVYE